MPQIKQEGKEVYPQISQIAADYRGAFAGTVAYWRLLPFTK